MPAHQDIPLNHRFRFIHEPLGTSVQNEWQRFIGRDEELNELVARILLSDGGAFLVTGYRGVGKTTFVNRVVDRLGERIQQKTALIGPTEIVSIYMNFARPMKPTELMFHILRGLRLQLAEKGLLGRLDSKVRDQLELAFMRTSLSMGYKASDETEKSFEIGDLGLKIPYFGIGSKLKIGSRRSSGLSREYSYLAYDDKAAEYDLIQITRQLTIGYRRNRSLWRNLLRRGGSPTTSIRLKMLFIFDELDKIEETSTKTGLSAIDEILGSLKNVFTTSGISFIFVAGRDTHERWLDDLGRGDSVYESIFTYARYLPALWTHVDAICDTLLARNDTATSESLEAMDTYLSFKKFLAFKGRGIPRRIIRGFNDYVIWDSDKPCLRFLREHIRQFNFYASLYDVLQLNDGHLFGSYRDESPAQLDQQRLSMYYLVDWILRAGLGDFTADEVIAASRRLSRLIAPAEQVASQMANSLLQALVRHEYIEEVQVSHAAQEVVPGGQYPDPIKRYRIKRRRLAEMGRLTGLFDEEAKAFSQQPPGIPPERYDVLRHIGRGGMSNVYEAIDKPTGRRVAIKQILSEFARDESYRARFKREAEILSSLRHPNVVNVYDVGLNVDQMYIVMEYVQGIRLADLIAQGKTKDLQQFLNITRDLLGGIQALHARGILWVDPKPGNIMITTEGRLILLDFGISRLMSNPEETLENSLSLGTPAYMSPEAVMGKALDERSDLYSIGVILFEMLSGHLPFEDPEQLKLAFKRVSAEAPKLSDFVEVPVAIEKVVMKCLQKEPGQRFQTAAEIINALPAAEDLAAVRAITREAVAAVAESHAREESPTMLGMTMTFRSAPSAPSTDTPMTPLPAIEARGYEKHPGSEAATIQPPLPPPEAPAEVGTYPLPAPSPAASAAIPPPTPFTSALVATPISPVRTPQSSYLTFNDDSRGMHSLNAQRNTLGRSLSSDVVIEDSAASRYHALITKDDLGYMIEDLNTANGTYVNQTRVQIPQRLREGDSIRIGRTVMVFHGEGQAASAVSA